MSFPDGRIKDGFFENNVFKGNTQVVNENAGYNQSEFAA